MSMLNESTMRKPTQEEKLVTFKALLPSRVNERFLIELHRSRRGVDRYVLIRQT